MKISNKNDLRRALSEKWVEISIATMWKLAESMPRILKAYLDRVGWGTFGQLKFAAPIALYKQ